MTKAFTKKTDAFLRNAGWFPDRCIALSDAMSESELCEPALGIFKEFGNLSVHPDKCRVLEFGPDFSRGEHTNIRARVICNIDHAVQCSLWRLVGTDLDVAISNIAWEEGQDLYSIAVDENGFVYSATWQLMQVPGPADVQILRFADSIVTYLNFWLDPCEITRTQRTERTRYWEENIVLRLPEGQR